jgi:GNAT superfamily N-acetyltransferase
LTGEATPEQLIRATAENHRVWFETNARLTGGEVCGKGGIRWIVKLGAHSEVTIPFPRLESRTAGAQLDAILQDCRRRKVKQVACWATALPTRPADLGARLVARGFEWGWRPHWMALDLHLPFPEFSAPAGFEVRVDDDCDWNVEGLSYYSRAEIPLFQAQNRQTPRRIWHFAAWLEGKLVGHSQVHLTTGSLGVAGIYSVGVLPSAQNQGIGKAVSLAACQFARAQGCRYAVLNSAADHLYSRLGFVSLGWGQTWWMQSPVLAAPPPSPALIAFAEAIGRGNRKALEAFARDALPADLEAPLPSGMTPMQLAIHTRKPASARWLMARGVPLSLKTAWQLGWKDRAAQMLAENPELANGRSGGWQLTPLHQAVLDNDLEFLRLLLTARPDLTLEDAQFRSTALGWARHFRRMEMVALMEASLAQSG